jgi:uncharacterized protein
MDELAWERLWRRVVAQFRLPAHSLHSEDHWKRVERYGLYVGQHSGADLLVVRLFALFHDSQRQSDSGDPDHGPRAASYAGQLCGKEFSLEPEQLTLLQLACRDHTRGYTSSDPTIGACWDADRLDLDRVGARLDAEYMSTDAGQSLARLSTGERWKQVGIAARR